MDEPDDKVLDPNFNMDDELNDHLKGKFMLIILLEFKMNKKKLIIKFIVIWTAY